MQKTFLNRGLLRTKGSGLLVSRGLRADGSTDSFSRRHFLKVSGLAVVALPMLFKNRVQFVGDERRVALLLDGVERWAIEPQLFSGRPTLSIDNRSIDNFRCSLRNARFPGTRLRADFSCELKNSAGRSVLHINFINAGWRFTMPAAEWLNAEFVPHASNQQTISLLEEPRHIGPYQLLADTVRFTPDWALQFEGSRPSTFTLAEWQVQTKNVQLRLAKTIPSLFANPPQRRSILRIQRDQHEWTLIPGGLQRELKLLVDEELQPFDELGIELAENSHGGIRSAAIAENTRPLSMSLEVGGELIDDGGNKTVLPLAHSRIAAYRDSTQDEFVFVGHLPDSPFWIHGQVFSAAVGEHSDRPSVELAMQNGQVSSAEISPSLKAVEIPIPGADLQTSFVPRDARLPFSWGSLACVPKYTFRAGRRVVDALCSVTVGCKETLFSLNGCAINVVRPADFLNLTFEFWNVYLRAVNGVPMLFPIESPNVGKGDPIPDRPHMVVYFPPQTVGEEAFPEDNQKSTPRPTLTSKKRIGGSTRIAFELSQITKNEGMELSLDKLLDWAQFRVCVPSTASYDPTHPTGDPPGPEPPSKMETAIEIPYRLLLAPSPDVEWEQTSKPDLTKNRTVELWRARVNDPRIRAVWSRDYPDKEWPERFDSSKASPADKDPFLTSLDRLDRFQIVHLSSDFTVKDPAFPSWVPKPINTKHLALTSLGGWLDCDTEWEDVPVLQWHGKTLPLEVSKWKHLATMARDQYCRVEYEGFLFPVGHRAVLVKETIRRFFDSEEGISDPNRCYLRQQEYILVKQVSRRYPGSADTNSGKISVEPFDSRNFAFHEVAFETLRTPPLDVGSTAADHFWPTVNGKRFRFDINCIDRNDDKNKQFRFPFKFVFAKLAQFPDKPDPNQLQVLKSVIDDYNALASVQDAQPVISTPDNGCAAFEDGGSYSRLACAAGQKIHFAPSIVAGDTELETHCIELSASLVVDDLVGDTTHILRRNHLPLFCPFTSQAQVHIPTVEMLEPRAQRPIIKYHNTYNTHGFAETAIVSTLGARGVATKANVGEVFGELVGSRNFEFPPDKGGGVALPNMGVTSLSRKLGPLAGDAQKFCDGIFAPLDFFNGLNARLLGVVDFGSVLQPLNDIRDQVKRIPQLLMQRVDALASAADSQIQEILNKIQAKAQPVVDGLHAVEQGIESYASSIKANADTQLKALKQEADGFADLWNGLESFVGKEEVGTDHSQLALRDVPEKSLLNRITDAPGQASPRVAMVALQGMASPQNCISLPQMRDDLVALLDKNAKVARDVVQKLQGILDLNQEFDFVNQGVASVQPSLAHLLGSIRSTYASVLSSLVDIPGKELTDAIENVLNDFENLSLETIFALPQHIGDLVVAVEKELKRLKEIVATVSDIPTAEFGLLTRTFESMASNVSSESTRLQADLTNTFSLMKTTAMTEVTGIQAQLGSDYQTIVDLLQNTDKLRDCVVSLILERFGNLRQAVDQVRTQLLSAQAQIVSTLNEINQAREQVLSRINEIRNLALQPVELKLDYTFSPLLKDGPSGQPIFRASLQGRPATMDVTVQIRQQVIPATGSLAGGSQKVHAVIRDFQIVLLPTPTFLIVKVNQVMFDAGVGIKPQVTVEIQGIELGDCLNFVKALQSAIPVLGNKGNGPFLDIGVREIAAGYRFGVGPFTLGALNVLNVAIEASVTLSLIGDPMAVRFAFCSRERPFLLSAGIWGGGGFFAIELNANRVTRLEASLEFGGVVAVNFGPAHGTVTITCGIYFSIRPGSVELSGFFKAAGDMDVAGLIHLSLIFYMGLSYVQDSSGSYARGQVTVHVEIGVGLIKVGYDLHAERQLAGSGTAQSIMTFGSDPTVNQVSDTDCSTLEGIKERTWDEYELAFA